VSPVAGAEALTDVRACAWCSKPPVDGLGATPFFLCLSCDPDGSEIVRIRAGIDTPFYDPTHSIAPETMCDHCAFYNVSFTNIRLCKPCWRDHPLWTAGLARYQYEVWYYLEYGKNPPAEAAQADRAALLAAGVR
jgi:hypothetical protein